MGTSTCSGWSLPSRDSGMAGTVGLHHAWWDTWYMSRTVPLVPGLWDAGGVEGGHFAFPLKKVLPA